MESNVMMRNQTQIFNPISNTTKMSQTFSDLTPSLLTVSPVARESGQPPDYETGVYGKQSSLFVIYLAHWAKYS